MIKTARRGDGGSWFTRGWVPLASLLLAFALRVNLLGKQGFWFDEAASAVISRKSPLQIVDYVQAQPFEHPPLYYLLLHGWMRVAGDGEFALRFLSVGFGVLLVALLWYWGSLLGGRRLAALITLIGALSPFQIEQSQEARMYTILACLGTISMILFLKGLAKGQGRWWIGFGLVTACGIVTHYYFLLLPLGQALFLLVQLRRFRPAVLPWLASQLLVAATPIAWLIAAPGPRGALLASLQNWRFGERDAAQFVRLAIDVVLGSWGFAQPNRLDWTATGFTLALALIGCIAGALALRRAAGLLGSAATIHFLLVVTLLVAVGGGLLLPHSLVARYLSFALPSFFGLIALGLLSIDRLSKPLFAVALVAVVAVFVFGLQALYYRSEKGQFGTAAREMLAMSQPGDAVVLTHPDQWPLAEYYFKGRLPIYYVPSVPEAPTDETVATALGPILASHRRVWLGPTSAWTMDPEAKAERWLQGNAFEAFKRWLPDSTAYACFYAVGSPPGPQAVSYSSEIGLSLDRYGLSQSAVEPGEAVAVILDWRLPIQYGKTLVAGLRLLDDNNGIWAERRGVLKDNTDGTLRVGDELRSRYAFYLPPGTPAGRYRLSLSVMLSDENRNLSLFPAGSAAGLAQIELGQVVVGRNRPVVSSGLAGGPFRVDLPQVSVQAQKPLSLLVPPDLSTNLKASFAGEISLLGYKALEPRGALIQGESLHFDLWWQATRQPSDNYTIAFQFVDSSGRVVQTTASRAPANGYPTRNWRIGEDLKDQQEVQVPNDLAGGTYEIRIVLEDGSGHIVPASVVDRPPFPFSLWPLHGTVKVEALSLLSVQVKERPRTFAATPSHILQADLGGQVMILGYDLPSAEAHPGESIKIQVYWKAEAALSQSYTGFAHLLDGTGRLASQDDSVPLRGVYPTTLWQKGEVVRDELEIPVKAGTSPGEYQIVVGMYESRSMSRLKVLDAQGSPVDDKVPLTFVEIQAGQ